MNCANCSDVTAFRLASTPRTARMGSACSRRPGQAGSALPAVVLFDGRVLADPSNAEVGRGDRRADDAAAPAATT